MYYMDVEELTAYLPLIFTSNELKCVGVDTYTPTDLQAVLEQSEGIIDDLRYKGVFVENFQAHAFPRVLQGGYVVEKDDDRVKKAICCIAYDLMKSITSTTSDSSRADLIRQGVKSISTVGVSESYAEYSEIEKNKISTNYVKYLGFCLFKGIL